MTVVLSAQSFMYVFINHMHTDLNELTQRQRTAEQWSGRGRKGVAMVELKYHRRHFTRFDGHKRPTAYRRGAGVEGGGGGSVAVNTEEIQEYS